MKDVFDEMRSRAQGYGNSIGCGIGAANSDEAMALARQMYDLLSGQPLEVARGATDLVTQALMVSAVVPQRQSPA